MAQCYCPMLHETYNPLFGKTCPNQMTQLPHTCNPTLGSHRDIELPSNHHVSRHLQLNTTLSTIMSSAACIFCKIIKGELPLAQYVAWSPLTRTR